MSNLTREQLSYLIQFFHPDKILARLPGMSETTVALTYAIDVELLREIKAQFADRARKAAAQLLADAAFAERIDRLPFQSGHKIVGLGDSITDDYQSWFEILRHALRLRRPDDDINLINAGISGDTSAQIVSRFLAVVAEKPDWIICMMGTNDARLQGEKPTKVLLSPEETEKNCALLRNFAATQTNARWLWMTPATVDDALIRRHWFLAPLQVNYRNQDLDAVAEIIKRQSDPVVDLQRVFGHPPVTDFLLDDGLHPSLEGQMAILRALVARLSP